VCRRYAAQRSTDAAARRELEDLRAAINYHRREGLCSQIVEVVLPRERPARDRWLTRSEAARLILAAWRYREVQKGKATDRRSRQHIAKFILVALYTGTRASAVCGAALGAMMGRGWIDHRPQREIPLHPSHQANPDPATRLRTSRYQPGSYPVTAPALATNKREFSGVIDSARRKFGLKLAPSIRRPPSRQFAVRGCTSAPFQARPHNLGRAKTDSRPGM
jgi:integrase